MKRTIHSFLLFIAVSVSAEERLKPFVGEFEGTLEQKNLHESGADWVATPVAVSGRWIVADRFAEMRGKYKLAGLPKPVELVFVWGWDPFQKEYRLVVLDDLVGLIDVFEQESAAPLRLSNFSHGTYFQDAHGRSYNRVTIDFLERGAVRLHWASSRDGRTWRDFGRLTIRPR